MAIKESVDLELLEEDDDELEDAQEGKFLTFFLNREEYGIEIRYVREIIGIQTITDVPDMPEYIRGVINLRGKVIPVMDMRMRFQLSLREYDDRTCIIVINIEEQLLGLIVDRVSEVLDINKEQMEESPNVQRQGGNRFIKWMGKINDQVKLLLDAERLLTEEGHR